MLYAGMLKVGTNLTVYENDEESGVIILSDDDGNLYHWQTGDPE